MSTVVGFMVDMTVNASMSSLETVDLGASVQAVGKRVRLKGLFFLFFSVLFCSFSIIISSLNPSLHPSHPSINI